MAFFLYAFLISATLAPLLIPNTLYGYDTEYSYIFRLPDFTYWVFDVLNKTASKFNQVNSLILQVTNISYFIENINQIRS